MTHQELARVEAALAVHLPESYRALMLAYPFPADSLTAECLLPDDADQLIEMNRGVERGAPGRTGGDEWPPRGYVMIGSDGGEECYLLAAGRADSPVYVYDVERGELREHASGLEQFVAQCRATEDEIRQDEEAMARKPRTRWWQFWR